MKGEKGVVKIACHTFFFWEGGRGRGIVHPRLLLFSFFLYSLFFFVVIFLDCPVVGVAFPCPIHPPLRAAQVGRVQGVDATYLSDESQFDADPRRRASLFLLAFSLPPPRFWPRAEEDCRPPKRSLGI